MLYRIARLIFRLTLFICRRWEVHGQQNLPCQGGVMAVANHTSNWDPIIMGSALPRQVYFMAKAELFKGLFGTILHNLGTFPVNRAKNDRQAIRQAVEVLKTGRVLGMFPEGTRSRTGALQKAHLGAAMIALKAGVPILPMAIIGSRGIFKKVRVQIGKPLIIEELVAGKAGREELELISDRMMEEISRLIRQAR